MSAVEEAPESNPREASSGPRPARGASSGPETAGNPGPEAGPRSASPPAPSALRRVASRAIALGVSITLALLVVEIALRVLIPAQTRFYVWPPRMKMITEPDPKVLFGLAPKAHINISTQGIRGPEFGPDTEYRVLAVGGSTTECLYIDEATAWPELVRRALPKTADGRDVWLGAVGKSGTNSRDHVVQLERLLPQYPRIDTVVLLVGVNDLTVALAQGDRYESPAPLSDPAAAEKQVRRAFAVAPGRLHDPSTDFAGGVDLPFYKKTALYQLAGRTKKGIAARKAGRTMGQDDTGQRYGEWRRHRRGASAILDKLPDLTAPLADYRKNLERIVEIAAARKVRLVLMTQPVLWRDDLSEADKALLWLGGQGEFQSQAARAYYAVPALAEAMRRYNAVLLDVCREKGLDCLDLAAKIPRERAMFYDDCHFTDEGSRAVAKATAEHLGKLAPFSR